MVLVICINGKDKKLILDITFPESEILFAGKEMSSHKSKEREEFKKE